MPNLEVGDIVATQHGPYRALAEVVELTERGAVIQYAFNATLTGYPTTFAAPDGTALTTDPAHGFIGRAHFASTEKVTF